MPDDEIRILAPGALPLVDPPTQANVEIIRPAASSQKFYARSAILGRPRIDTCLGAAVDVFWLPANNACSVSRDVPFVLTVHDLSFDLRPQDFTRWDRMNHRITNPRKQSERADRILVTTQAVFDDVVTHYRIDPARIDIVPPGIGRPQWPLDEHGLPAPPPAAIAAAREKHGLPERYFLQVGALEPRKRPDLLAAAQQRAQTDAVVAFAGAGRMAEELEGLPGVHLLGYVPDDELDLLYGGAIALCYPSLLEGYGFPPQEAALRGTAAIVSDIGPLREVLGESVRYVKPDDLDGLAAALDELADSDDTRRELARRAYAVAAPRTWQAAGEGVRASLLRAVGAPDSSTPSVAA